MLKLKEGEKGIITAINLDYNAQKKLLTYGLALGVTVIKNYSPKFSGLCNFTINGRSISIRKTDAKHIELVKSTVQ